jgi:Skp family chaperone for outer membrane proteins
MKYFVKFFVVTFFLLFSTDVIAEQKIVVLDLKYVLNNSKAGKNAQDFLKKSYNNNLKKYADMEKALKKEEQDLLTKKTVLSKEEYTKKTDALRKKVIDFQSQRRSAIDKIATQRSNSRATLIQALDPILDVYIKEKNIALVLDKKFALGGVPENDITTIITEKLNKTLPSLNLK